MSEVDGPLLPVTTCVLVMVDFGGVEEPADGVTVVSKVEVLGAGLFPTTTGAELLLLVAGDVERVEVVVADVELVILALPVLDDRVLVVAELLVVEPGKVDVVVPELELALELKLELELALELELDPPPPDPPEDLQVRDPTTTVFVLSMAGLETVNGFPAVPVPFE